MSITLHAQTQADVTERRAYLRSLQTPTRPTTERNTAMDPLTLWHDEVTKAHREWAETARVAVTAYRSPLCDETSVYGAWAEDGPDPNAIAAADSKELSAGVRGLLCSAFVLVSVSVLSAVAAIRCGFRRPAVVAVLFLLAFVGVLILAVGGARW